MSENFMFDNLTLYVPNSKDKWREINKLVLPEVEQLQHGSESMLQWATMSSAYKGNELCTTMWQNRTKMLHNTANWKYIKDAIVSTGNFKFKCEYIRQWPH